MTELFSKFHPDFYLGYESIFPMGYSLQPYN